MLPVPYHISCSDQNIAKFLISDASKYRIQTTGHNVSVGNYVAPVDDAIVVFRGDHEEFLPKLLYFMGNINNIYGKLYILLDFNAVNAYSSETLLPILRCIALKPDKVRILPHILLYKPFQ
jgi:hypothetical protein